MHRVRHELWLLALIAPLALASASGCDKVRAVVCLPVKASATAPAPRTADKHAAASKQHDAGAEGPAEAEPGEEGEAKPSASELLTSQVPRFALPFAWEKSPKEPLARARTYLRELADDNAHYMGKGPAFFQAFAAGESPRATVITCADSRVQVGAFDATAENDDYTVRNLGNQLENGLGSVHYGIDQLRTPVLIIVGHTGCTAVRDALSGTQQLARPTARELSGLKLKPVKGALDDKKWAAAVVQNVHDQVKVALREFGPRVNAAELTIVGAVYDLENELGQGHGRMIVINVNGNQDPARLRAFGDAIMSTPNPNANAGAAQAASDPLERLARALANPGAPSAAEEPEEDAEEEEPAPAEHHAPPPPPPPTAAEHVEPAKPSEAAEHQASAPKESPAHHAVPAQRAAPAKRAKH
jgi:carbonic anhydrase